MTTENVTNRTVKAPLKTGQNAAPGGISRPQLALRGTTWHKPRALDLAGVGTPPRFPPARLAARARTAARAAPPFKVVGGLFPQRLHPSRPRLFSGYESPAYILLQAADRFQR